MLVSSCFPFFQNTLDKVYLSISFQFLCCSGCFRHLWHHQFQAFAGGLVDFQQVHVQYPRQQAGCCKAPAYA